MKFITYSANREFFLERCHFLQYYDEWAYDYTYNDITRYWDENNYWDKFPIKLGFELRNTISLPGKNIVGGVAYTFENNALHIKRLFTCERYRKQVVAKQFLEEAWRIGFHNGCKCIRMWCDKDAIPFYEKLGYNFMGYNEKEYGYVYLPMLSESMQDTLNKTKDSNPFDLLQHNNISLPEEANVFTLNF